MVEKTVYVADDGTEFNNESECRRHELDEKNEINKFKKEIFSICGGMTNHEYCRGCLFSRWGVPMTSQPIYFIRCEINEIWKGKIK